ncbi:acyl-CoA dehydrogenase [Parafrankia colletiae]|uniref:Acyl-CoA dehydrogenase n=1 Tax=Parafrankia colletiae TaxID=573497 RepID=A0A1S1QLW8_9ACTN|nr:acyl-CoA dehydrogenase family protein [Parafrankia colletiae]MCK9900914.1 acyl-CoA dehydrogenase family protein [Frankia sp. Cpl3]OHV34576.1 acyl-CoA dehydrogenase [Parafrankia colletiae]
MTTEPTDTSPADTAPVESVEEFRARARTWIRANLQPLVTHAKTGVMRARLTDDEELAEVAREREIQRMLFDAKLAGICFPPAYGGLGLSPAHQRAFNEEITGFEYPSRIQAPTFSPCAAVLLEFGTEEQKLRHIPAILKGEEIWMQFLSEPGSGSDVASVTTSAVLEGDDWILNGSKIWTTGAWWSDWALCLARTNWDVSKHRGLTVFILPINQDGVDVQRIEMLNGNKEFCQEFLTDVRVPDSDRIGNVDDGWTVGTRWMFHERMLHNSPFVTMPSGWSYGGVDATFLVDVARDAGRLDDPRTRDLIGEGRVLDLVREALQTRISTGVRSRKLPDQSAAIGRLFAGLSSTRVTSMAFDISGSAGAAWAPDDGAIAEIGTDFLLRQTTCIGGGTTEIARNVISERVLGMPREAALDRDRAFRDVPRGGSARS